MEVNIYKNNISFNAGLTQKTVSTVRGVSVKQISDEFKSIYKIDTNFKHNGIIASCTAFCADIFENLTKHFNLPLEATPKRVRVYSPDELIKPSNKFGFCIPDTKKVLKTEPPFELRSIFFQQHDLNVEDLNDIVELNFKQGVTSSNHFLYEFIHEWAHNVHLDLLYKKYGYNGVCPFGQKLYSKDGSTGLDIVKRLQETSFNDKEKEVIEDVLGSYAATNPFELVAETYTKIICDSLDKDTLLPAKNPFDDLHKFPKDFLETLQTATGL